MVAMRWCLASLYYFTRIGNRSRKIQTYITMYSLPLDLPVPTFHFYAENENPKCGITQAWLWVMAQSDGKIDRNMRVLISILHHYLNIRTYASCGGHVKPSTRVNTTPKGEFYVRFVLPLNYPEGVDQNILSIITEAIRMYNGKVFLENDNETYNFPIKDGCCSWTISGYGVTPINFASTLFSKYLSAKRSR